MSNFLPYVALHVTSFSWCKWCIISSTIALGQSVRDKSLSHGTNKINTYSRLNEGRDILLAVLFIHYPFPVHYFVSNAFHFRYLTTVKGQLKGLCQVQHAPFAKGSGAVDSRYGVHCLSMMLRTTALERTNYDAIVFNFGMHDINYSKMFPEVSA